MNSLTLLFTAIAVYVAGYFFYGKFISSILGVDARRLTPAHQKNDGVDFVPAKNWIVLFGHHFSSICGAGPIIGPVLAVAYWGWGVSFLWIVLGAVLMGAVSDFTSLLMSVRKEGESIASLSGFEISKRAKIFFSVFLWISLILVIAVFSIFAAQTFITAPEAVVPSLGLIPAALLLGWMLYIKKVPELKASLLGLVILGSLLVLGKYWELVLPEFMGLSSQTLWVLILLFYCFIASVTPVQVLLQPRDYLGSFILFGLILMGMISIFFEHPEIQTPLYNSWNPKDFPKAGSLWPMLFVTIACGAISGFHALVSSGTTCKQLSSEGHACRIGYGGMLVESFVGILVLICVSAGLSHGRLTGHLIQGGGGPIVAFSEGYGNLSRFFLGDYGTSFAVLALNTFILTTLDTATRITRYLTTELFGIKNKYIATLIVVVASAALALSGKWNLLWPAFGTANQLIAAITLLVAACWLINRSKSFYFTMIPAVLLLLTTVAAFAIQAIQSFRDKNYFLALMTVVLISLAFFILSEVWFKLKSSKK